MRLLLGSPSPPPAARGCGAASRARRSGGGASASTPISRGAQWGDLAALAAIALCLIPLAVWSFARRDVRA